MRIYADKEGGIIGDIEISGDFFLIIRLFNKIEVFFFFFSLL